jgi:FtsP/CotA-like multicopper oxidase with cupredoxin domain
LSHRSQSRSVAGAAPWLAAIAAITVTLTLVNAVPSLAIDCSNTPAEPPFKEPPVIEALCNGKPCLPGQPGAISTTFRLEIKEQCVPGSTTPMKLRTYVYPDPANPKNWIYGFPGPTLKLRKAFKPGDKGDTVGVLLVNNLPPDSPTCNSACPATNSDGTPFVCPDRSKLPSPPSQKCGGANPDPLCCCWVNVNQKHPDCMHGDNTTNLHLHGSHISPQSPQDYVLLELHPGGDKGKKLHAMAERSDLEVGKFQYQTDPFPYTQAEGTHWYHPHKHGSVSLQVANGMPGAMIILGPFDKWLDDWYAKKGVKLTEKLMVAQQIQESSNLFGKGGAPKVLINGLLNPKLTVQAGEVQRWRVINATMQKAGQLTITFPAGASVMQIAQDGVQFARQTYAKQPLLTNGKFVLSPGNRADFLVRMPKTPTKSHMTEAVLPSSIAVRALQKIRLRDQEAKAKASSNEAEAPILTLEVLERKAGTPEAVPVGFPSEAEWPEMPWYLKDIQPGEVKGRQDLVFSMASITTGKPTQGGAGDPSTVFLINDRQYDPDCVNVTTKLGTADEWHIENSSGLPHPFHIHTNPFQLVEQGAMINGKAVPSAKYDPPIWHDTIALPTPTSQDVDAGPLFSNDEAKAKCPGVCQKTQGVWNGNWTTTVPNQMSVCGCDYNGYVKLLHRYLDFTGEYVLHCHFLGHEDRGMMFGVQTVCEKEPTKFGKAKADGSPECVPGNLTPATKQCSEKPETAETHHHQ